MQKKLTKMLLGYLLFGFLLLGSQTFASFSLLREHPNVQLVEVGEELSGDQEYNYFPFAMDERAEVKVNGTVSSSLQGTYPAGTVVSFVNKAGDLVKATMKTQTFLDYYPIGNYYEGIWFRGGTLTFTINDSDDFKGYFTFGDMDCGESITFKRDEIYKIIVAKDSKLLISEENGDYIIRSELGRGVEHTDPNEIVTILFNNKDIKSGITVGGGCGGVYFGGNAIWKKNESGTLIINHLDSETGLPLADRVVLTGALNTQIALPSPLSISNYDFTGNLVSGHTFANQKPVELNYYYTHKTGSITVNYLTTTATGERKLIDSIVFTGKVGSKILPENKVIPGYLLQTTIQEQEISASDSMVNLYYTLKDPLAAQQENVTITRMRPITELLIKVTGAVQNIQIKNLDQLPGLTYDLITSKISGTTNAAVGVYPLEILATDPYNNTLTVPFTVTVVQGIAPKLDQLSNQIYIRNRPISPLTITGHDDYKISDVRLLSPLPTGLRLSAPHKNSDTLWTYQIEGTPNVPRGDYPVELQIDDAEGLSHTMKFLITIRTQSGSAPDPTPITPDPQPDPKPDPIPVPTPDPTVVYPDNAVFNPTIFDGQCYTRRPYLGIKDSEKIRTSEEFKKALSFLWSYEMTMYDRVDGYDPYRNLSREEAAKIFSQFAINVLCRKPDLNLHINYTDTENADPTLKPYITLAYQLGVMKGSGMGDGAFRPFDSITKAEINAVLIRMILKSYLDESKSANKKRYSEYNKVSTVLGIITKGAGEETINRNNTALMLFRAYKNQPFEWMNIDYYSFVLKNRADFVK